MKLTSPILVTPLSPKLVTPRIIKLLYLCSEIILNRDL